MKNVYAAYNVSHFFIYLQKIIKIDGNLTKFRHKQFCTDFSDTRCICNYACTNAQIHTDLHVLYNYVSLHRPSYINLHIKILFLGSVMLFSVSRRICDEAGQGLEKATKELNGCNIGEAKTTKGTGSQDN